MVKEPRIILESRENYHRPRISFHKGHFRIVERDFPEQHNQVIAEEVYCDGIKVDGHYIISLGIGDKVVGVAHTQEELSRKAYTKAKQYALMHATVKKVKFVEEITNDLTIRL